MMEDYPEPVRTSQRTFESSHGQSEPAVHTTECAHFYQESGAVEESGLTPVTCSLCWGGHMVDLREFEVLDGAIAKRP